MLGSVFHSSWIPHLDPMSLLLKLSQVIQSCPTLCDPVDCSPPSSSVHGTLQAGILEWVAISFSRGSSQLRDWTWVSCITGGCFTLWAITSLLKWNEWNFWEWLCGGQLCWNFTCYVSNRYFGLVYKILGRKPNSEFWRHCSLIKSVATMSDAVLLCDLFCSLNLCLCSKNVWYW